MVQTLTGSHTCYKREIITSDPTGLPAYLSNLLEVLTNLNQVKKPLRARRQLEQKSYHQAYFINLIHDFSVERVVDTQMFKTRIYYSKQLPSTCNCIIFTLNLLPSKCNCICCTFKKCCEAYNITFSHQIVHSNCFKLREHICF